MKRIFLFVLLLIVALHASSQNLVSNPGFESWSSISKPAGWSHSENSRKDSLTILSGVYSCFHTGGSSTSSDLGQTIKVIAGKEYTLSFSIRTSETTTGNGSRIWSYWKDSSGASITDPASDDILRPSKYIKSSEWKNFSLNITAPINADALYLEVRTYPGSSAWWDDFFLGEKTTTGIPESATGDIKIFPVPFTDILTIEAPGIIAGIEIINICGSIVYSEYPGVAAIETLSVPYLPHGIYFIRISCAGRSYVRKVMRLND
ncbi:MAG: carbohydrate binding domain-containing protein [Bacteroidales bacterium]|jgi:hypothetical protein|nr:carbohydrate binding domain-containing protein [Bacteroidales bacterium]